MTDKIVNIKSHQAFEPDAYPGLSKEETAVVDAIALRMTLALAAEFDKLGHRPTDPAEVHKLALDLAFINEITAAIVLRSLNIHHPLQDVITECLSPNA